MKLTRLSLYLKRPAGGVSATCTPQGVVLFMKSRRGNSILPPEYGAGQLSGIFILSLTVWELNGDLTERREPMTNDSPTRFPIVLASLARARSRVTALHLARSR